MKKIVCLVGPSGVGKSSYAKMIEKRLNFFRPYTITTRNPRNDDNLHIYTIPSIFKQMICKKSLMEWDVYKNQYYGVSAYEFNHLEELSYSGIIFDASSKAAGIVKSKIKELIIIVLLPDDISWLKQRLLDRNTNDVKEIENRLKNVDEEIIVMKKMNEPIIYCKYSPDSWENSYDQIVETINKKL